MDDIGIAEDMAGAEDIDIGALAGADEQSADASGIGTVSVWPASVMRVVVQPQVGIGAPDGAGAASGMALTALLQC